MKKFFEDVWWKIDTAFKCIVYRIKNKRLERRIEKMRRETEELKRSLETITGEPFKG